MEKPEPIWNWKVAEWEKFSSILQTKTIRIPTRINERWIEYLLKQIYKHIYFAMEKTIPKIQPTGKQNHTKWY